MAMSLYRVVLRSVRRQSAALVPRRALAFSSAEEAAAERRRRKRRLRIEPPLHALRRESGPPPPRAPDALRLPDSTSALVGPRLNLHNRVQSLIRASDLDSAAAVARRAVFSSTRPTVFTCNAVIAAMYRSQRYSDAEALFSFFFQQSNLVPNVVSYNNLINTLCDQSRVDDALAVYRRIIAGAPFSPSPVTYRHLTKGLVDSGRLPDAMELLREMLSKGHGADSLVFNNLIAGFLRSGDPSKAAELFDELRERCLVYDGAVHATFMDHHFSAGQPEEAMASYKALLSRGFKMVPATCNVLLACLLRNSRHEEAEALFQTMLDNHTPPNFQAVNSETFNAVVNEWFRRGEPERALAAFRKVGAKANSKAFSMDVAGYNNIISRYCEAGMIAQAEAMFEELCSKSLSPDVGSHRTLIDAYLGAGRVEEALRTLVRMVEAGLWLVADYGATVFAEMVRHGKAAECVPVMVKLGEKDPKPDASLYEVLARGLCDTGALDPCRALLEEMLRHGVPVADDLRLRLADSFSLAARTEELEGLFSRRMPPRPNNSYSSQPRHWSQAHHQPGTHPWSQTQQPGAQPQTQQPAAQPWPQTHHSVLPSQTHQTTAQPWSQTHHSVLPSQTHQTTAQPWSQTQQPGTQPQTHQTTAQPWSQTHHSVLPSQTHQPATQPWPQTHHSVLPSQTHQPATQPWSQAHQPASSVLSSQSNQHPWQQNQGDGVYNHQPSSQPWQQNQGNGVYNGGAGQGHQYASQGYETRGNPVAEEDNIRLGNRG